ncbi:zinc finger-containing ubiquitin peptidase 1 [Betta splendens]|uniref:Zinc finger-containing ubiquitin peptidase 1 n=1 Tax=Betta splendens TaxID=158456 RepID=A0A6P7KVG5_BETSP|nr:zinc finger-containing ubiquitin peptidase 1 [Betta splendens]XP_028984579.1 zinc finger-containing ubiquitin peptidase 1 [Betta splendens]
MLTCEICGKDVLLKEDMKTHLLLSHLENDMYCPLCSLSTVSYDELCLHISCVHPDEQYSTQTHSTSIASVTETEHPQTSQLLVGNICNTFREATPGTASGVNTDSLQPKPNSTHERESLSSGESTCNLKLGQECVRAYNNEVQMHEQTKAKWMSSPKKGERRFECPVCFAVCSGSFTLQEHVELHLDQGTAAVRPVSDLELAIQLQQEEDQKRRQKEAQQEREEFKKLQRQYGLDNRGGYSKQMERSMERAVARGRMDPLEFHCKRAEMMESLASGTDDGRTRTRGVIRALCEYYQAECRDCIHVWLSCDTDHYGSSAGDQGWGCGYRNFQMLLSSLHRIDMYSPFLQAKTAPSIPHVQCMIEEAWRKGLDPQGASHFNSQLQGTRAWIGATEIFSLLTSLEIHARIIDFHQPTGPGDTHPRLFDWVKEYFSQSSNSGKLPPRLIQTSLPPLYLQHQGHSCSIIGLEQRKNGHLCLLVLDPGSSVSDTRKLLSKDISRAMSNIRRFPSSLKHKQYQVVAVQGLLSAEGKKISILKSRTLQAERIP